MRGNACVGRVRCAGTLRYARRLRSAKVAREGVGVIRARSCLNSGLPPNKVLEEQRAVEEPIQ